MVLAIGFTKIWHFGGQMMKYKVGDKIKFVKDCKLASGSVIQAKSVWVVNDTSKEYYLLRGVGTC